MPESVNCWMPIPGPAGQLFHADSHSKTTALRWGNNRMVRPCARKVHQPGCAYNSGNSYFPHGEIPGLRLVGCNTTCESVCR